MKKRFFGAEKTKIAKCLLYICVLFAAPKCLCAQTAGNTNARLTDEVLQKISPNIFEVVAKKAGEGNTEYLFPPAFEKMNPVIRDDPYAIMGTAFLMNDGFFYSSCKAFKLLTGTQYSSFALRDGNGNVFSIEKIESFSTSRDYIKFSVKDFKPEENQKGLKKAGKINQNTPVFAASRELGDGLVIRGGIIPSRSLEKICGEWRWIRISEPAKPLTFGGPLLNNLGEVLGILSNENPAEKLVFALPFDETEVIAPNTGEVVHYFSYQLPNMPGKIFDHKFLTELTLPQDLPAIQKKLLADFTKYKQTMVKTLSPHFNSSGENGYLQAFGSADVLSTGSVPAFPLLLCFGENKKWQFLQPEKLYEEKGRKGEGVLFGSMMGYTFALVNKGENRSFETLMADSKWYTDYLLLVLGLGRQVAQEEVPIVSFGKAEAQETFTDCLGRKWQKSLFSLPFADSQAIVCALPLPEGVFIMLKIADTDQISAKAVFDVEFIAGCIYPRYSGKISDWQNFLAYLKKTNNLYAPLDKITMNTQNAAFNFDSPGFAMNIPEKVFKTDDETTFRLALGFAKQGTKAQNQIIAAELYSKRKTENYRYIYLAKMPKPADGAKKEITSLWEKKLKQEEPYNAAAYNQNECTYYDEIILDPAQKDRARIQQINCLSLEIAGSSKNEEIKKFAAALKPCIKYK